MELFGRVSEVRIRQPFRGEALPDPIAITGSKPMADMSATATRETGGTKSILRSIRSTPASNPETGALRAEVEGLRLALSIAQEALREERSDKEHWRDEAKQLRQLLSGQKPEPKIINVAAPEAPHTVEAPTLGPALETEPEKRPSSEMTSADSAAPAPQRWWGRLFA
jgi:hypothetical protein